MKLNKPHICWRGVRHPWNLDGRCFTCEANDAYYMEHKRTHCAGLDENPERHTDGGTGGQR